MANPDVTQRDEGRGRRGSLLFWLALVLLLVFLPQLFRLGGDNETAERLDRVLRQGFVWLAYGMATLFALFLAGWLWLRRRLSTRLPRQLVDLAELCLADPHPHWAVRAEDFPKADAAFYRRTQAAFETMGFRLAGDATDALAAETPYAPDAFYRCMLSEDGTRLVTFIKPRDGWLHSFSPTMELWTEAEDGRFFLFTSTVAPDHFSHPPELCLTTLPADTTPAGLVEAFNQALAAYQTDHPDFVPRRHDSFADVLSSLERINLCHARYRAREGFYTARDYTAAREAGLDETTLETIFSAYHKEHARRLRARGQAPVDGGTRRPWHSEPAIDTQETSAARAQVAAPHRRWALRLVAAALLLGVVVFAAVTPRWMAAAFITALRPAAAQGLSPEEAAAQTLLAAMPEDDQALFHRAGSDEDPPRWWRFANRHAGKPAYAWWAFRQLSEPWFFSPAGHDVSLWQPDDATAPPGRHPAPGESIFAVPEPAAALSALMARDPDNGAAALIAAVGLARSGVAVVWLTLPDPRDTEEREVATRIIPLRPDDARLAARWLYHALQAPVLDMRVDALQRERLRAFGRPDGWGAINALGQLLYQVREPDADFWEDFVRRWIGLAGARLEPMPEDRFDVFMEKARAAGLLPETATPPPSAWSAALPDTADANVTDAWSAYEMLSALQTAGARLIRDNPYPDTQRAGIALVTETSNQGASMLRAAGRADEAEALLTRGVWLIRPEVVERLAWRLAFDRDAKNNSELALLLSDIDKPLLLADETVRREAEAWVAAGTDSWLQARLWRRERRYASFSPFPQYAGYGPPVRPEAFIPMRRTETYAAQLTIRYVGLVSLWLWLALEAGLYFLYAREGRRHPVMKVNLVQTPWAAPGQLLPVVLARAVLGWLLPTVAIQLPTAPTAAFGLGGTGTPNLVWAGWLMFWSAAGAAGIYLALAWLTRRWIAQGERAHGESPYQTSTPFVRAAPPLLCLSALLPLYAWHRYDLADPEAGHALSIVVFLLGFGLFMATMCGVLFGSELNRRPYTLQRLRRHRFLLPALAAALFVWMTAYPLLTARQRTWMARDALVLPRPDDEAVTFPRYAGLATNRLRAHASEALAAETDRSDGATSDVFAFPAGPTSDPRGRTRE